MASMSLAVPASVSGGDQQADVVGHEDIGVNGTVPVGSRFLQPVELAVIVLFGKKAGLTLDATLDNVLRHAG
jgi:hypothetical protein